MTKNSLFLPIVFALCAVNAFAQQFYASLVPAPGECVAFVKPCDWGASVEKILICTKLEFKPEHIKAKDFDVHKVLYAEGDSFGLNNGKLDLTDAYTADSSGNRIDAPSSFIAICTLVHPEADNSNPFVTKNFGGGIRPWYGYKVENDELDFKIKKFKGFVSRERVLFSESEFEYTFPLPEPPVDNSELVGEAESEIKSKSKGKSKSKEKKSSKKKEKMPVPENVRMKYACYIPDGEKLPLILWFHGMGESGNDLNKLLFGIKTTALAQEKIQSHFENGVAILAPQCPSGWLETTEVGKGGVHVWEPFDKDAVTKPVKNFFNTLFEVDKGVAENSEATDYDDSVKTSEQEEKKPYAAVSYYTAPVIALLEAFLFAHPEIDSNRIYVGGCSAGGYMTVNMMIQSPELFAAAFPICEYYLDSKITNTQINQLAKKPLWFTYATTDETVKPAKCSEPTITRLRSAGIKNLHTSIFENVTDTSGNYLLAPDADEDDKEYNLSYVYDSHYSWIYVLNDECSDGELNLFDWLAEQKLKEDF